MIQRDLFRRSDATLDRIMCVLEEQRARHPELRRELTWNGLEPLTVSGNRRTFLEDGDEVVITAWAPGPAGSRVGLGEVRGTVMPSSQPQAPSDAPAGAEGNR